MDHNCIFDIIRQKSKGSNLSLIERLEQIRSKAEVYLSNIPIIFPEYTTHDIRHKDRILKTFCVAVPKALLNALNSYELFFLAAATYLHDIGMSPLDKLNDIDKNLTNEEKRELIRDTHHIRVENYLLKYFEEFGFNNHEAFVTAKICKGHRKVDLNNSEFDHSFAFDLEKINIPLLAFMLRLVDELDLSYVRAPGSQFENIPVTNSTSQEEWMKHSSISEVTNVQDGMVIKCSGGTSDPKIFNSIKHTEKKINTLLNE